MLSLLIVAVLVSAVVGQDGPGSGPVIKHPAFCKPLKKLPDVKDIADKLNKGEMPASLELESAEIETTTSIPIMRCETGEPAKRCHPFTRRCEDGPAKVLHKVFNEYHWPPIVKGSCRGLWCKDPPCLVRRAVWRSRCVYVFKKVNNIWICLGYRKRWYIDHVRCGCKKCEDIKNYWTCIRTKPCPNIYIKRPTWCYWKHYRPYRPKMVAQEQKTPVTLIPPAPTLIPPAPKHPMHPPLWVYPGQCKCCIPYSCRPPLVFNAARCRCECPRPWHHCPIGHWFHPFSCHCYP